MSQNKLDDYRDGRDADILRTYGSDFANGFAEGFDAAIALDLPVKFAEWQNGMRDENGNLDGAFDEMSWKELYQYWIDNVYKPE